MQDPIKLLFITFPIKFFLSHRLPIAQKAMREGYEVHLISTKGEGEDILEKEGIHLHPINITRSKANPFQEIKSIRQIYMILKKISPNIVHNVTIKPVLYGTLAARLARVPAIVNAFSGLGYAFTAKGVMANINRLLISTAYKYVLKHNKLTSIVQNNDDKKFLINKNIIKKHQTILIKGSGVNLEDFKPTKEPFDTPVVILPARLLKDKGIIEFVNASRILLQNNVKVRMVLVGQIDLGNPSSITNKELSCWSSEQIIEHWGYSSNMPETIMKSNIICLPSYREGLPKSLIEACAAGRAIITTDVPGCREMIDSKSKNGILIPPENDQALASAILELIDKPQMRKQMALNGRKMAVREFSIDKVINETLKVYDNLLI